METAYRSKGRGAGPSKLMPLNRKPEPWQGHLILASLRSTFGVHPRCVQVVSRAAKWALPSQSLWSLMIQVLWDSLNRSSGLSQAKSSMCPALNTCGGSKRTLGIIYLSIARVPVPLAMAKVPQATPAQDIMKLRRVILGG